MTRLTQNVQIVNKLGLHARAAATLVRVTSTFECDIKLTKGSITVDAKSILGMMSLAAAQGTWVSFNCDGVDADQAMVAVVKCISEYFGEGE
jgi:phosphocarrier protein HPr